MTGINLCIKL
jgi:hypothetical protein